MTTRIGELTRCRSESSPQPVCGLQGNLSKNHRPPVLPNPPHLDDKCIPPVERALAFRNASSHEARREPGAFVFCEHVIRVLPKGCTG